MLDHLTPRQRDRFWSKVDRREPEACWEWQGARTQYGYGAYRRTNAQRTAWEITHGEIPGGSSTFVCHTCDNPPCCNPAHLFLGTHADNVADMMAKRRHNHGEMVNTCRLTEDAVREMRSLYVRGRVTYRELAVRFGMSPQAVGHVVRRYSWRHVS